MYMYYTTVTNSPPLSVRSSIVHAHVVISNSPLNASVSVLSIMVDIIYLLHYHGQALLHGKNAVNNIINNHNKNILSL